MCEHAPLLKAAAENKLPPELFDAESVLLAQKLLEETPIGPYTNSKGAAVVRHAIAAYTQASDAEFIFVQSSHAAAISSVMQLFVDVEAGRDVVLHPMPADDDSFYAMMARTNGAKPIAYRLPSAASDDWTAVLTEACGDWEMSRVALLVVCNPHFPSGSVLTAQQMRQIVDFCARNSLILVADESWHFSMRTPQHFASFGRMFRENFMPQPPPPFTLLAVGSADCSPLKTHAVTGAFVECVAADAHVQQQLYKQASVGLCAPISSQVALYALMASLRLQNSAAIVREDLLRLWKLVDATRLAVCQVAADFGGDSVTLLYAATELPFVTLLVATRAKGLPQKHASISLFRRIEGGDSEAENRLCLCVDLAAEDAVAATRRTLAALLAVPPAV